MRKLMGTIADLDIIVGLDFAVCVCVVERSPAGVMKIMKRA